MDFNLRIVGFNSHVLLSVLVVMNARHKKSEIKVG